MTIPLTVGATSCGESRRYRQGLSEEDESVPIFRNTIQICGSEKISSLFVLGDVFSQLFIVSPRYTRIHKNGCGGSVCNTVQDKVIVSTQKDERYRYGLASHTLHSTLCDIYNVVGLRVVVGSDPEKKYEPSHKIENVSNWVKLRVSSLCAL
jgi:hypothetical protein